MRSMGEVRVCTDGKSVRVEKSPSPGLSPKGERRIKEKTGNHFFLRRKIL
jgi:hypothetical protein